MSDAKAWRKEFGPHEELIAEIERKVLKNIFDCRDVERLLAALKDTLNNEDIWRQAAWDLEEKLDELTAKYDRTVDARLERLEGKADD